MIYDIQMTLNDDSQNDMGKKCPMAEKVRRKSRN